VRMMWGLLYITRYFNLCSTEVVVGRSTGSGYGVQGGMQNRTLYHLLVGCNGMELDLLVMLALGRVNSLKDLPG
jgi:hypothetical protein